MKELFPDGVIPKIKDLQDELDKANTEYGQGLYAENGYVGKYLLPPCV